MYVLYFFDKIHTHHVHWCRVPQYHQDNLLLQTLQEYLDDL